MGHFSDLVDVSFTARMEQQLDEIAEGRLDWLDHLQGFYFGEAESRPGLESQISEQEPRIEFPRIEIGDHPENGRPIVVRVGRYGPYLQQDSDNGERVAASVPDDVAPADLTLDAAVDLLEKASKGAQLLGHDPDDGDPIYLANGRYGAYVQKGETPERGSKEPKPRRASVPKGIEEPEVTIDQALKWLSLPRTLGVGPRQR